MLCGQYDSIETYWFVVFIVFYSNLCLSIRTQVFQCTVFTDLGQLQSQLVSQICRHRHVAFGFVGCITEHHTLVTGTDGVDLFLGHGVLFGFKCFVNAQGDICGLFVDGCNDTAGVGIEAVFAAGIADFTNGISHDFLDIYISFCGDLTHDHDKTGCCAGLTGNTAHWILCYESIKDRIGNLVTHFVRMSFGYGLGCE